MNLQRTIAQVASLSGQGLFSGKPVTVTFRPAPINHGLVFSRVDLHQAQAPALIQRVLKRARRTSLRSGEAAVDTTEHCLAAIYALGIDNLLIELDSVELPGLDGSALPYAQALLAAGFEELQAPRATLVVNEPVMVRQDDAVVAAMPSDDPGLQLLYDLDYGEHPAMGRQLAIFDPRRDDFVRDLAPARTYVLESEAKALQAAGLGRHLTPADLLVIGPMGPLPPNAWRFGNEAARHKLVDLLGDLALVGAPIQGRIVAYKSGHALNHALVRKLLEQYRRQRRQDLALHRGVLDIRKIARILPHRYPLLLVDRVVELDGDRRALGVKNVTFNEPFFQGHFPGTPVMPGVLIVEAMAQLAGLLVGQRLEHAGRVPLLMSLDRVKLRRPVTPGDQLMLEAETVRIRSTLAHARCRAYVGDDLVAEAEIKFLLVDNDQE